MKQFSTNITLVALLMSVGHMFPEAVGLFQKLVANWALELGVWFVVVTPLVLIQFTSIFKDLAARFACKVFLLNMAYLTGMHSFLVITEVSLRDSFPTQVAAYSVGSYCCFGDSAMVFFVGSEAPSRFQNLATGRAREHPIF